MLLFSRDISPAGIFGKAESGNVVCARCLFVTNEKAVFEGTMVSGHWVFSVVNHDEYTSYFWLVNKFWKPIKLEDKFFVVGSLTFA
jgi:hypothetical protein